jgi:hypothetical protein
MDVARNLAHLLTARRIRMHALLLAVCLWTVYAVDMSTPGLCDRFGMIKGADFLHFYTLGKLALENRGDLLYNMRAQSTELAKLVPEAAGYVYVPLYGPQVSLFFVPFALLPYEWALTAWLTLNLLVYALCCFAVWKTCANLQSQKWIVLAAAIAFPGFFHLLLWGQTSGLALLCFTLVYLALRTRHPFLAGLALGSLIFKPQLGLAAAVVFVFAGEWQVVAGSVIAASLQLGIAWWHYGTAVMRNYLYALTHLRGVLSPLEPRLYHTHSLRAFWILLLPWSSASSAVWGLYFVSAVAALLMLLLCWRSRAPLALRYSALLVASVLVAPHLTVYDLVILAPAFLLLADWALSCSNQPLAAATLVLLYLCYPLFLLGPLTRFTHLQLSVVALFGLLWLIQRASAQAATPEQSPAAV